jgi:cysteinyl-tRNA synthetase
LFAGTHPLLERGYSPMTVRFFMLQAHYRSTLDFSNEALQAAEKGFQRLINAVKLLPNLKASANSDVNIDELIDNVYNALNDDFNTPITLAALFDGVRMINSINDGKSKISEEDLVKLRKLFKDIVFDVLGLMEESTADNSKVDGLMKMILEQRASAKARRDFAASDGIRDQLKEIGIEVKDGKEGATYTISN